MEQPTNAVRAESVELLVAVYAEHCAALRRLVVRYDGVAHPADLVRLTAWVDQVDAAVREAQRGARMPVVFGRYVGGRRRFALRAARGR